MKLKATSLIMGICLVALASVASPAYAASYEFTQSGFSAFRVQYGSVNSYATDPTPCLVESYGAVINYCNEGVALIFDTPVLKAGSHSISITDAWFGQIDVSFPCNVYAYTGTEGAFTEHTSVTFTGPGETQSTSITVPAGGYMQVICVLPAATEAVINNTTGIAKVTWSL